MRLSIVHFASGETENLAFTVLEFAYRVSRMREASDDAGAVYCDTQVLCSVKELSSRE